MMVPKTLAEEALGLSLPSRRDEEWKWTDLRRLIERPYGPAPTPDDARVDRLLAEAPFAVVQRVVVVNGRFDPQRSRLKGLALTETAPAVDLDDPLVDLQAKLGGQGVTLHLPTGDATPVEVVFVSCGEAAAAASRLHIVVAENARASVIERHVGEGSYLHCPLVSIALKAGARLDRIKLEQEDGAAQHLAQTIIDLEERAVCNDFTFTVGAGLIRQNVNVSFRGPQAQARINGSYLLGGRQHVDTRLVVDHRVPNCMSRELFKCVMQDSARGIFQGKVVVRPDAQKTDGKQSSHALLLSETAEFDAKPELEIYADDVVCGHGTTCGDLNHDHLFYLMARGIPQVQARAMLVAAFLEEAMDVVEDEALRGVLHRMVEARLVP
jgi:Fe-S cluster assembly protein SufD